MTGIKFVTNGKGQPTAVQIDLKRHGRLWEDFYDALVAKQRAKEPTVSWETVKKRLIKAGKLRA
jgi:hypothetical protein